jgi:hypothetical protein
LFACLLERDREGLGNPLCIPTKRLGNQYADKFVRQMEVHIIEARKALPARRITV